MLSRKSRSVETVHQLLSKTDSGSFNPCCRLGTMTQIDPGTGNASLPFTAMTNIRLAGSELLSNEIPLCSEQSQAGPFLGQ